MINLNFSEKIKNKFLELVNEYKLLSRGDRVLIGLSGGADSVCLACLLKSFQSFFDLDIFACYLNHSLRGEESDRDEMFCRELSSMLNIPFISEKVDVKGISREKGLSIEEAGRIARYSFFDKVMVEKGLNKLAIAHNLDDLVETLFYRLIKGSGISGLKGIPLKRKVYPAGYEIIRPLLFVEKTEIESFLKENGIPFVVDSSNADITFARNYIRRKLIPVIEERFKGFKKKIEDFYRILYDEEAFWEEELKKHQVYLSEENGFVKIDAKFFQSGFSEALKRRMIRYVINEKLGLDLYLPFRVLRSIIDNVKPEGSRRLYLSRKLCVECYYGNLYFKRGEIVNSAGARIEKLIPEVDIKYENLTIKFELIDRDRFLGSNFKSDGKIIYFSADSSKSFFLRRWEAGDRIEIGDNKSKKLSDIFVDYKIERYKRKDTIVIINENNELIAFILPDIISRVSRKFYVCPETVKIGVISLC